MNDIINNLYAIFDRYRIGDDFTGCDCCVGPEHSAQLAKTSLRELTYDDLELYSRKAMTTWGGVEHFKHFLPRLFELTIEHRDDFLDLAVVFGKLKIAQFHSWPCAEQDTINQFFKEYWDYQLADPVSGAYSDSIDTVLCAISNALTSVQPFLNKWLATNTDNAKRHLAAFILNNDGSLLEKGALSSSFWDASGKPYQEVIDWLRSDAALNYLNSCNDSVLADDFAFALPQLTAIRSSLSNMQ